MDKKTYVSFMLSLLLLYKNFSVIIFRLFSFRFFIEGKIRNSFQSHVRKASNFFYLVFLYWRKTLCDMLCNYYIERTKHISLHSLFLYGRNLSVLLWSLSDRRKHTCHYCVPFYWRKLYDMLYNRSHIGKHSWLCVSSLLYTMLSSFLLHSFDSLGKCEIWYVWSLSDRKHIVAYAPLNFCFFIEGNSDHMLYNCYLIEENIRDFVLLYWRKLCLNLSLKSIPKKKTHHHLHPSLIFSFPYWRKSGV